MKLPMDLQALRRKRTRWRDVLVLVLGAVILLPGLLDNRWRAAVDPPSQITIVPAAGEPRLRVDDEGRRAEVTSYTEMLYRADPEALQVMDLLLRDRDTRWELFRLEVEDESWAVTWERGKPVFRKRSTLQCDAR